MKIKLINTNRILAAGLFVLLSSSLAKEPNYGKQALTHVPEETKPYLYAKKQDVRWFEDAKFGTFICWGPCSLEEVGIGWGRKGPRGLKPPATKGLPAEEYDNLYKRFNPTAFNAEEWVKMIRDSGAKYMIFLTKHHDGFCMFDAKNTEYKITNTPFGRDVCKELADECHKYGIKIFWYYSQPDWYHPDYATENHDTYREYMVEHIRQLLTDYGKIDGIWFDCLGSSWQHWNTPELVKEIRTLQPGILINDRWGWGMPDVKYRGDFDTPEQNIGKFNIGRPWESCATMAQSWSWRGSKHVLTEEVCVRMLIQCAGSGGNLALDVGPRPDGIIDPKMKANYLAMGKWLEENGESLYGTRAGPYKPGAYGVSTHKGSTIYIHLVADFSPDGKTILRLPKPEVPLLSVQTLAGGHVPYTIREDLLEIDLSAVELGDIATVLALEIEGDAGALDVVDVVDNKPIPIKMAAASSFLKGFEPENILSAQGHKEFSAGIHRNPRWAPNHGDAEPWISIEFAKPETLAAITMKERIGNCRIREFVLEYDRQGTWKPLYRGTQVGLDFGLILTKEITTSKIRIKTLKLSAGTPAPTLEEFQAYSKGKGSH